MLLRRGCRGNVTHALERRRAGLPRQLTRLRRQRQLLVARTGRDTLTQSVACGAEAAHSPIILIIVLVRLQIISLTLAVMQTTRVVLKHKQRRADWRLPRSPVTEIAIHRR